uniref:Uncharacterized protein n=1 Tax=viral metagenome TaxID=1070528 RepID=A0A6C0DBG1_9ZZZZ
MDNLDSNQDKNAIKVVTANVSFVTSYPGPEPFKHAASENAALFALLKKNFGDIIDHDKLFSLFERSIESIKKKLEDTKESGYCAAGLQELNNTEEVYYKVKELIGNEYNFICSNVLDEYYKTKPCVGFIVKEQLEKFIPISKNKGKLYSVIDNGMIDIKDIDKPFSYTLTLLSENPENLQYISIRDLGSIDPVDNIDYCLRQTHNNGKPDVKPDSGRPIAMIIKGTTDKPEIVHINCHMPNPSILKHYIKINNTYECQNKTPKIGIDEKVEKDEKNEDIMVETSILIEQKGEKPQKSTEIWLKYCRKRLSTTIQEMLGDFGFENLDNFEDNTTWIITGDFNDIGTLLKDSLREEGIKVFGKDIYFNFVDVLETCCPNTNSSGGKDENKKKPPFSRSFSALGTSEEKINNSILTPQEKITEIKKMKNDKEIYKDQYFSENISNSVFEGLLIKGDNCGFGKIGEKPTGEIIAKSFPENIKEHSSDHLFVVATYELPQGGGSKNGGSRKRKSTKTTKKTQKRKHTKRQNKHKSRHHSKRR